MPTLFFSYSHRDETLRDALEIHLSMLKRQGVITTWHDRRIGAGKEFDQEISQHLEEADVVLLLVSPDFLASDYCYEKEMTRAMERHAARKARVIPVILRPCDWHDAPFGRLLAAPKDGKPITKYPNQDEAFLEVVQAIRKAVQEIMGKQKTPPSGTPVASVSSSRSPDIRSSNLRVQKDFTDRDRDRFLQESFEYIAKFFENSIAELETRNPGIEGNFRRIDTNHFTASIYKNGRTMSECGIWLGGHISRTNNIMYSSDPSRGDNSYNDSLSAEDDGNAIFLKSSMAGVFGGRQGELLSQEGAAEHFWEKLIQPLQQQR
jgi:hypothetical protein